MTLTQILNEAFHSELLPHGNDLCGFTNCDFVTCDNCPLAGPKVAMLSGNRHIVDIRNDAIRNPAAH